MLRYLMFGKIRLRNRSIVFTYPYSSDKVIPKIKIKDILNESDHSNQEGTNNDS